MERRITAPKEETLITVPAENNSSFFFDFDISNGSFERSGNDLTVLFENGGQIILSGFFIGKTGEKLSTITLENGNEMSGEEFLLSLDSNFDISTATGPATSPNDSGGINAYSDHPGDLISGVDRLGSLGTYQWDHGTTSRIFGVSEPAPSLSAASTVDPYTPTPIDPITPQPATAEYDARAVLYAGGSNTGNISFHGLNITSFSWMQDAYNDYFIASLNNGLLTLTLKQGISLPAGLRENAYAYLKLVDANGKNLTVQVVVNQDNQLNSPQEDAKSHDISFNGLAHGEWHAGQDLHNGSVLTSHLDDTINFTGNVTNSILNAGSGKDQITVNGTVKESTIIGGTDDNFIKIGDLYADAAGSLITTDGGFVKVQTDASKHAASPETITGLYATNNAEASIITKSAHVDVILDGTQGGLDTGLGVYANGGHNRIDSATGAINVTITNPNANAYGLLVGSSGGSNRLSSAGDISVTAHANTVLSPLESYIGRAMHIIGSDTITSGIHKGSNTISAHNDGSVHVSASGADYGYGLSSSGGRLAKNANSNTVKTGEDFSNVKVTYENNITTENGNITLNSSSTSGNVWGMSSWYSDTVKGSTNRVNVDYNASNALHSKNGDITIALGRDTTNTYAGSAVRGMAANSSSWISDNTGDVSVSAIISNSVYTRNGNISLTIESTAQAIGLEAITSGSTSNNTGSLTRHLSAINELSSGGDVISIKAYGGNSTTVARQTPAATGLFAQGEGAVNRIYATGTTTKVLFDIKAETGASTSNQIEAVAMTVSDKGLNEINAQGGLVSLTVKGPQAAVGLKADNEGRNIIKAERVEIKVEGENASAMQAIGHNTHNQISGSGRTQGLEVNISAHANDPLKAHAMKAVDQGQNIILGSAAGDLIKIKGAVAAETNGRNFITTEKGNDRIMLDGLIKQGSLLLTAGDGYDILVLKAQGQTVQDAIAAFNHRYQPWLSGLSSMEATALGIEKIQIVLTAPDGTPFTHNLTWLNSNGLQWLFPGAFNAQIEVVHDLSATFGSGGSSATYTDTIYADLSNLTGSHSSPSQYQFESTGDDALHVHGNVTATDFYFYNGGHDMLRIDGDFSGNLQADSTILMDFTVRGSFKGNVSLGADNDHVNLGSLIDGNIDLGAGDDVLHIGRLEKGNVSLGAGNDWAMVGGIASGTTLTGSGNSDINTLVLKLQGTENFSNNFNFDGVSNIQRIWVDLVDTHKDTLDANFLQQLFDAAGNAGPTGDKLYLTADAIDDVSTITGTGSSWTHSGSHSIVDSTGTLVQFDAYTHDHQTIYLKIIAG